MLLYRDKLFPRTPVVFSGVTYVDKSYLAKSKGFKGVSAEPDLKANMELILTLNPKTRRVVFINEWTIKGRLLHDEFLKIIPLYQNSIDFQLLEDLDTKEIFNILGNLSKDSAILYGIFSRDKVGRVFDHKEIVDLFSRNTVAPMFSPWDFNLGQGIVGGVMTTAYSQGDAAGRQAVQLLRGARLENISMFAKSRTQYMFDYNQLKRFRMGRDRLPIGSVVINYPETFYEKFRTPILTIATVITILLIVISVLILNIRFKERTEKELKTSQEKLRSLAWRLAEVEDKERKALSRELHDQVGQNLTILGVNLNLVRSLITKDESELVQSRISDSLVVVKQTTQQIRNVMGNLRSPVLDDYGLVAAIEYYGKQYADRTGIAVHVRGLKTDFMLTHGTKMHYSG
jgi:hypothetical protein